MPTMLLLVVLLVPLLAGCVPGGARSDGVPSADAPFTLTALDVGQSTFPFRGMPCCSSPVVFGGNRSGVAGPGWG